MKITLNGEEYDTKAANVEGLLKEIDIVPGRYAVEVNHEIIRKPDYQSRGLNEGDRVEVVSFIGGGGGSNRIKENREKKFS
jgi:sulfur carrier protein